MEDNPVALLLIVILACWLSPGRLAPATAASRKEVSGTSMKDVAEEGKDREERRGEIFRLKNLQLFLFCCNTMNFSVPIVTDLQINHYQQINRSASFSD